LVFSRTTLFTDNLGTAKETIMQSIIRFFRTLFNREEGQTLAEYALILVLIAIAVIAMLTLLGGNIGNILTQIANAL